jgi:hypothetical protein
MDCNACERPSQRVVTEAARFLPKKARGRNVKLAKTLSGSLLDLAKNRHPQRDKPGSSTSR